MEKLHEYQGLHGRIHDWQDSIKERISSFRENTPNFFEYFKEATNEQMKGNINAEEDYSHIFRHKTRAELARISAAVMGIEFSYAAETAFVSPILLEIGVSHQHMSLVWALSPLIGFFSCPILGSMSDRCKLNIGRRRPFILFLSVGVLLGLLLVPNGETLGYSFGDPVPFTNTSIEMESGNTLAHRVSAIDFEPIKPKTSQFWGIFFTILGTVLLDFNADACQSPARAYLLDICIPEDHAKGLSTFTIMAGLGGFMGYSMGGINWDATSIGRKLGGHVKAVFTFITFIFIACVTFTITSFKEIPLWVMLATKTDKTNQSDPSKTFYGASDINVDESHVEETLQQESEYIEIVGDSFETSCEKNCEKSAENQQVPTESVENLSHYLMSIVFMPHSLKMVCLTNLFCWMAHVCYSLYFTDFVGEAVFGGNPKAVKGSKLQYLYEEGVRFGCWGMAMYSLSCACYSLIIEKLIQRFKSKTVYIGGLLFYCFGMSLMALTRAKVSVIIFSWAAGVMYSTLFTMPYLLVAYYHSMGTFDLENNSGQLKSKVRGLGTDIAIVSSMVFLAQFILSICMGTIVSFSGTTTSIVTTASVLSFCGALSATQIINNTESAELILHHESSLSLPDILPIASKTYDKNRAPKLLGQPTVVYFHVTVLSLDSINEESMTYVTDVFLAQSWRDPRLRLPENMSEEYRILDVDWLHSIWRPDSFFKNAKKVTFHEMSIPNHYLWLYHDKTLLYMSKLTLVLSCAMKFESYPHDTQICSMMIESLSHTVQDLVFIWNMTDPLVVNSEIELPQLDISNNYTTDCTIEYSTGNFTCLAIVFNLRRRLGYHLFHTYIPSALIVVMSWISFWIKPEAIPARVTLGVTSLLTLATQNTQSQQSLPPVSYVKAIDVWMSSCSVFVFLSLMEFAVVNNYMGPVATKSMKGYSDENLQDFDHMKMKMHRESIIEPQYDTFCHGHATAIYIDKFSRFFFPFSFFILNIAYWTTFL